MRIATFNMENLDEHEDPRNPVLDKRIKILRPQIQRLKADILCLQEIHGQERTGKPRDVLALKKLFEETPYQNFHLAITKTLEEQVFDVRNLVVASRYPIKRIQQFNSDKTGELMYRPVSAKPTEPEAKAVRWERPVLYCVLDTPEGDLHLINLHLKSRIPSSIKGQKRGFKFNSASGWAEGYFVSSMKRVGQALEVRILIDEIFDEDSEAKVVVCGDFNAEPGQVPVEAICGKIENTANPALHHRQLIPASNSLAEDKRYSHIHAGHKSLLDHLLFSTSLLPRYREAELHTELLHDESIAYATDTKYPESDHAPFVAVFEDL